jgi:hypothetical protein
MGGTTQSYAASGGLVVTPGNNKQGSFTCQVQIPDAWLNGKTPAFDSGSYDAGNNTLVYKSTNIAFQDADPADPSFQTYPLPNYNIDPTTVKAKVTVGVQGSNGLYGKIKTGTVTNTPPPIG